MTVQEFCQKTVKGRNVVYIHIPLVPSRLNTVNCSNWKGLLPLTSTSHSSSMASALKLQSLDEIIQMNIHCKFQQLSNSRTKAMDYHIQQDSKTREKSGE